MDESFDTGPVFMMERVEPRPDMSITTLRYYTALLATDMCVRLLKGIANGGMEARDQPADRGQYYSYVPWVLKPLANWKLRRYARRSTGDQRE
jgi:methionyl-tRNA formyltransferase